MTSIVIPSDGYGLLRFVVLTEPDLQRFAHLALEAVRLCGGSRFIATTSLANLMPRMRTARRSHNGPLELTLTITAAGLTVRFNGSVCLLCDIPIIPDEHLCQSVAAQLRNQSESRDAQVLLQRNREAARVTQEQADILADLEARLMEKRRDLEALARRAATDPLTGLWNRGAYDERLRDAIRAAQTGKSLCLIFFDLDNFKGINDTQGHGAGDDCLVRVAELLKIVGRAETDSACRLGGDEFAMIIPADLTVAKRIATEVQRRAPVGMSTGIAVWQVGDNASHLAARADQALYEAKHAGRGCVVISS